VGAVIRCEQFSHLKLIGLPSYKGSRARAVVQLGAQVR
jgi:hypothetical protein